MHTDPDEVPTPEIPPKDEPATDITPISPDEISGAVAGAMLDACHDPQ